MPYSNSGSGPPQGQGLPARTRANLDNVLWEDFFESRPHPMENYRGPDQVPEEYLKCFSSLGSRQCSSVRKAPFVGSSPAFSSGQQNLRSLSLDTSSGRPLSSFLKPGAPVSDRPTAYNRQAQSSTTMYPTETTVAPPANGGPPATSSQLQEVLEAQHCIQYANHSQSQSLQSWDHSSSHSVPSKNSHVTSSYAHSQSAYPVIVNTPGHFSSSSQFHGGHSQQLPPLAHLGEYMAKTSQMRSAALLRSSYGAAISEVNGSDWSSKRPCAWSPADCAAWFREVAHNNGQDIARMSLGKLYGLNGPALIQLDEMDFLDRDPVNGAQWYRALRKILDHHQVGFSTPKTEPGEPSSYVTDPHAPFLAAIHSSGPIHEDYSEYIQDHFTKDEFDDIDVADTAVLYGTGGHQLQYTPIPSSQSYGGHHMDFQNFATMSICGTSMVSDGTETFKTELDSDMESSRSCTRSSCTEMSGQSLSSFNFGSVSPTWSSSSPDSSSPSRRIFKQSPKADKPKKSSKHGTRGNHLWEFIRDLLKSPIRDGKIIIKWENKEEGVFRFVESEKVAKLWGEKKANPRMTYEKLSRAMRTYYGSKILEPVAKNGKYPKKLVYKFGSKVNWA